MARISVIIICIRVIGLSLQILLFAIIANSLIPRDFGIFSAVFAYWGLARMLGPFGFDLVAMRDIASAHARHDIELVKALCKFFDAAALTTGILLGIVSGAALYTLTLSGLINLKPLTITIIALGSPAYTIIGLMAAQLRGVEKPIASQAIESLGLYSIPLLVLATAKFNWIFSLDFALAVQATSAWIVAMAYLRLRPYPSRAHGIRLSQEQKKNAWRHSIQIWQALVVTGLAVRAPTYISLILLGPTRTALLEIALRFGTLPSIFTSAVSSTFSPVLASSHARHDLQGMREAVSTGSWLSFAPALCSIILIVVFGRWFLHTFFPPFYQDAYVPLIIVGLATTVNAVFSLASNAFLMTNHQHIVRLYSFIQLSIVLVFGAALTLLRGLEGLCFAIIFGTIVRDIGLAFQLRTTIGVHSFLSLDGLQLMLNKISIAFRGRR